MNEAWEERSRVRSNRIIKRTSRTGTWVGLVGDGLTELKKIKINLKTLSI